MTEQLPEPVRAQLDLHQTAPTTDLDLIRAVDLHKAKFDQRKALREYREGRSLSESLPDDVYTQSKGMVMARNENSVQVSGKDAWTATSEGEEWVGSIPVQMYRQRQGAILRGFPYLIGFVDGEPRVILNKIIPDQPENMDRFYANEWARPWVIAEILDATGFTTDNLVLATMKAMKPAGEKVNEDRVVDYLYQNARENVFSMLHCGEEGELVPWEPREPELPHQTDYVRTQVIGYRTEYSLFERLGHGDSIREIIEVFQGKRKPKAKPPDRGMSLPYALGELSG